MGYHEKSNTFRFQREDREWGKTTGTRSYSDPARVESVECIRKKNLWKITLNTASFKSSSEVNSRIIWVDFKNFKKPVGNCKGEEELIRLLVWLNQERKMKRSETTATLIHQWQNVDGDVKTERVQYAIRNL